MPLPPPPLCAQHSAGAQEGFAAVSCTLAMPHHQHFEHHPCLLTLLHLSSVTPFPAKECDSGISKKEEWPPVNSSEWWWGEGGEKVLFSPVAGRERVQSLRSLGAEHGQGCSVPHSGIPSTPTLLKASPVRCNQCCSRPRGMGVCVCVWVQYGCIAI